MARKKRRSSDQSEENLQERKSSGDQNDLYQVLGVERNVTQEEIRKAYHKLALRLHPDKNPDDEGAKEKFQSLQSVIAILGDPEKRKVYDETGSVEDVELSGDSFKNVYQYFRALYKQITEEDIDSYAQAYRGSKDEIADLKNEYTHHKGNMELVFTYLMCSDPKLDSHRFMEIIDSAISDGELKEYNVYRKWAEATSKLPAPSDPLALPNRRKKSSNDVRDGPLALIAKRSKGQMDSLVSALEAKYGGKGKGKKGSKVKIDEPSEEEFQAAHVRVMGYHRDTSSKAPARALETRKNNKRKSGKLD
ncbi:DnaJ homolog subfamily C member 9 [Marchantia polymorpha subsp. ruderalis]